jgi:hypothetical protein
VIEPSSGRVGQVNGEEQDDEEVIILPAYLAHKAIVLQPNVGIGFAVIFDDDIWHPKMFREACVVHVALELLGPWPFGSDAAPFLIVPPVVAWVAHADLGTPPSAPCEPNGVPEAWGVLLGRPTRDGSGPTVVKTRSQPWGVLLRSFAS